jgi:hypothetical protein
MYRHCFIDKLFFALIFLGLVTACQKTKCEGDCAEIRITGQAIDSATNKGLANIPIEVNWERASFACVACSRIVVKTAKTDNAGNFDFTVTVDKAKFGNYYLNIEAQCPGNYMGYSPLENKITRTLSQYVTATDHLRMVMYPKARLTIQLQNTQNDTFQYFSLRYRYSNTGLGIMTVEPPPLRNTHEIETAAGLFTKLEWSKNYGFGQNLYYSDSIKCSATGPNVFVINY